MKNFKEKFMRDPLIPTALFAGTLVFIGFLIDLSLLVQKLTIEYIVSKMF